MKCKCPACGSVLSLDVLIQHEQAAKAVFHALSLNGELGRLAVQYLGLFRPAKSALTMERVAKLLNSLLDDVQHQQIERNGQTYPAPIDCWLYGLETVLNSRHNLKLPLNSHGYLYEVMTKWQAKSLGTMPITAVQYPTARTVGSKTSKALANLAEFANE
ncbi:hypothetical protein [Rodentibacter abscessus]|uniref:hypothetical protein n=1 Tax=Rodentibacter abscessus TaxID=3381777 RepID=UPI00399D4518